MGTFLVIDTAFLTDVLGLGIIILTIIIQKFRKPEKEESEANENSEAV